ncbi:hypothetical protein BJV74DRAFT_615354 [Russula compacta]|nr:hypothetical protein BJV74DRAFT_615354 [Russula compacta]
MSFTPASINDVLPGDYLTMTSGGALDDTPDAFSWTGGSSYYPPCTSTGASIELATLLPTYNGFYPSSTPTASATSGDLSMSWDSTPATWSGAYFGDLLNPSDGNEGDDAQPRGTNNDQHEQASTPRRTRGPNRRRPGTGYTELMDKLPQEVQDALKGTYENCCEVMTKKDHSTVQKHQFSNRHCANLPPELQAMLPLFTCPAFVAIHESCRNAKYVSCPSHNTMAAP